MELEFSVKRDKSKKKSKFAEMPVPEDSNDERVKKKKKSILPEGDGNFQKSPKKIADFGVPSDMDSEPPEKRKKKAKKGVNDENFDTSFSERSDGEAKVEKILKKRFDVTNSSPQRSVPFSKHVASPTKNKVSSDADSSPKKTKRKLQKTQNEDHHSPSYSELPDDVAHKGSLGEKTDSKDKSKSSNDPKPSVLTVEGVVGWSKEDVYTLIKHMNEQIPSNDSLTFPSRVKKINWDKVSFGNHPGEECRDKWHLIERRMRGYRILSEVLHDAHEWVSKPWQDFYRSAKKNRHPEMPKRPLTSYMLFYMTKKDSIQAKNPGLKMLDLAKLVSQKYQSLSDKKKQKYVSMAAELSKEYHEKMTKFLEAHPEEGPVKKSKVKKLSNPFSTLTKPKSAFKLFFEEKKKRLESTENFDKNAFTEQVKEIWKNLNTKKKVCWIRWALEEEKNYLEGIKEICSIYPDVPAPKYKSVLKKGEIILLERAEGRPDKPPNSAYALFCRTMLKDPDFVQECKAVPTEKLKKIATLWSELDPKDKEAYELRAKMLAEQYKLEYASYLESLPEDKRAEEDERNKRKPRTIKSNTADSKLKQLRLEDSFKNMAKKSGALTMNNLLEDEDEEDEEEEEEEAESEEEVGPSNQSVASLSQDEKAILKRVLEQEPTEPPKTEKEFYRKFHPWLDDEEIDKRWQEMSEKGIQKYSRKLFDMKQAYLVSFNQFLQSLSSEELKLYSASKKKDDTESDSSDSDDDPVPKAQSKKTEESDSSSDD